MGRAWWRFARRSATTSRRGAGRRAGPRDLPRGARTENRGDRRGTAETLRLRTGGDPMIRPLRTLALTFMIVAAPVVGRAADIFDLVHDHYADSGGGTG